MKSRRVKILVAAVVLFVSASPVMAVIEFKDGLTHDIDHQINDDVWVDYESPGLETTLNILDGAIMPYHYHVKGWEDSIINILGGSVDYLYAYGSSQVTVYGGSIGDYRGGWGGLSAYGSSQVTVSGGLMHELDAYENSQVAVSDGLMHELDAYENSQVAVSDGRMKALDSFDSSQVTISGGSMDYLYAYDISQVTVSGGSIYYSFRALGSSQVDVSGGSITGLGALDSSQVAVSGGSMITLSATDSSKVTVSGGVINSYLRANDSSQVTVSGGLFGRELRVWDNSVLTIDGWDFAVDGMPVGYTELYSVFGGHYMDEPHRQLTGTLLSGDPINNQFRIGNNGKIVLVPEPASAVMLGLGSLFLALRRRRQ